MGKGMKDDGFTYSLCPLEISLFLTLLEFFLLIAILRMQKVKNFQVSWSHLTGEFMFYSNFKYLTLYSASCLLITFSECISR